MKPADSEAVLAAAEQELAAGEDPSASFKSVQDASTRGASAWLRATVGLAVAASRAARVDARALRKAVDDAVSVAASGPPDVKEVAVRALHVVADLHADAGDDDAAASSLARAQELSGSGLLGASSAHRLGALCTKRGQFDDAERHYDIALDLVSEAQGESDPAIGALLDDLASVYARAGRHEDAEAALAEAALQLARATPADSALHAQVLLRLGTMKLSGRATQALLHFHEAYALLVRLLGDQHPLVAIALEKIAAGHLVAGELGPAHAFAARALRVAQNAEAPSARVAAAALTTLAAIAFARNDRSEAIDLAARALATVGTAIGATDEERAALMANLARYRA